MKLTYLNLYTTDPAFNLAAEQYVFDCLPRDRMYLMLWQNDNAVIIGKFQNTMAEINTDYVKKHGIRVVRRLSGGGAVYHDMGNLNFTIIADAGDVEKLNLKLFCEPIIRTLQALGVPAEINGRNDMTVDGKKFSGNSQYLKQGRVMHHGTLLFDSDLSRIGDALQVDESKIKAKGIKSVRSRVTNLKPYLPDGITLENFRQQLIANLLEGQPGEAYEFNKTDLAEIEKIKQERYLQWDWNYGFSPACSITKKKRIEGCGSIEVHMDVEHGEICELHFFGDYFSTEDPKMLAEKLIGVKPEENSLKDKLKNIDISRYFTNLSAGELITLLSE